MVPIAVSHHEVHLEGCRKLPDGRIAWEAIDGTSSVSGLLPTDDPLAWRAMRSLRSITPTEARHRWRDPPLDVEHGLLPPAEAFKVGGIRQARRIRRRYAGGPYDAHEWQGLMLETGANIDAFGAPQLAFMEHAGLDFPIKRLAAEVSTGGGQTTVIGEATARVSLTSPDVYAEVSFKVLSSTSPTILGLPTMNTIAWALCTKTCTADIGNGQLLPLVMNNGHLFLYWKDQNEDDEASFAMNDEEGMTTDSRPKDGQICTRWINPPRPRTRR